MKTLITSLIYLAIILSCSSNMKKVHEYKDIDLTNLTCSEYYNSLDSSFNKTDSILCHNITDNLLHVINKHWKCFEGESIQFIVTVFGKPHKINKNENSMEYLYCIYNPVFEDYSVDKKGEVSYTFIRSLNVMFLRTNIGEFKVSSIVYRSGIED